MAELDRLLTAPDTRILTLTGPPGVGKTRLAIAVAAAAAPRFPDGVAFVDLTDVRDPPLVAAAVLEAAGSADVGPPKAADQLVRALADKNMLLVVDNFEHVLDAGPALAAVLAESAGLRLLTTSRERLHLRAEREIPVRPLGLPRDDDRNGSTVAPAVEMLVQCVRRFEPGFDVTPGNRAALAEICARLDGLPLALELAAARLKLFTPGELTFRLRHRMSILVNTARDVPRRHRTLRAALAWSHDLLKPNERAAFRRVSVFVGGATLDAAWQVCGLDDPIATITSLVDKSLLHRRIRPDGVAEFVMLESLREYAAELLVEHGEEEAVTARHARYFADLAVLVETAVGEAAEAAWADSVRFEQGNLRKALAHATAADDAGLFSELGNTPGVASSRYDLAQPARHRGDADGAADQLRESLTRFREMSDARAVACATWALLAMELRRKHTDGTEPLLAEVRGHSGATPDGLGVATCPGDATAVGCPRWEAREVAQGGGPARAPEAPRQLSAVARGAGQRDGGPPAVGALTVREQQVARLVAGGSTNRQIGQALGIAEKTTEAHVHSIIRKLGAQNRAEVAARVTADERASTSVRQPLGKR